MPKGSRTTPVPGARTHSIAPPWVPALLLVLLGIPSASNAQDEDPSAQGEHSTEQTVYPIDPLSAPRPTLTVVRINEPIVVDGRIDEPVWQSAVPATDFVQATPQTGYPATERTEVRVLYDDRNLYLGAVMYDSEPSALVHRYLTQDFTVRDEDVLGIALDTFHDRSNGYYFWINPNGALRDSQAFDNSRSTNGEWEGIVHVRSTIHDDGWSAEVAIPFTTLRFDASRPEQTWGIQFARRVRRKSEEACWAPLDLTKVLHTVAYAGTLEGLEGLRPNRNLQLKPFVAGRDVGGRLAAAGEQGATFDGGLDLKYGVTSRLTLDLSWRTDFSQVDVDEERVNLSRFSLFFPEKCEFFIENAGLFQFGDQGERNYRLGAGPRDFTLFHSRRIGLHEGRPVPIVGGGRLNGRIGDVQLGLINMQTEAGEGRPAENFTVVRVRRSVLGSADLGALLVNRQSTDGSGVYNRSWGVDANVRISDRLIINSYVAGSAEPHTEGSSLMGRLGIAWRDPLWDASALVRRVGQDFNPGAGFVRRRGIRHHYATVGIHPRPNLPLILELNPYVEVDFITDLESALATRILTGAVGIQFVDGSLLSFTYTDLYERLEEGFEVVGREVPAGRYAFGEGAVSYTSDSGRPLSGSVRFASGGYFQGERWSLSREAPGGQVRMSGSA